MPPQAAYAAPPAVAEQVLAVIPNAAKKKSMFKWDSWNLVFTNRRMLGALITEEMVKAEADHAAQAAREAGSGTLKRLWNTAMAGTNIYKRYPSMTPEQILAENPENLSVELSQIESVKARSAIIGVVGTVGNDTNDPDTLTIRTNVEKMEFQLKAGSISAREAVRILRPILGDRVK